MKLTLNEIKRDLQRSRFDFVYTTDAGLSKYFTGDIFYSEYEALEISSVPDSIAVIPFLGNVLPIAWYLGFDVEVGELDSGFCASCLEIQKQFSSKWKGRGGESSLKYSRLVVNDWEGEGSMILFSGGVDSHSTLFNNGEKIQLLVSVHGADIPLNDAVQWKLLTEMITDAPYLQNISKQNVRSNLRKFYSYLVNRLLQNYDWWGQVQHGFGLIALLAPLSYVKKYSQVYIASSGSEGVVDGWGSSQLLDESIHWGKIRVIHNGRETDRFSKTRRILEYAHQNRTQVTLKVCYATSGSQLNCCRCEKCCRTILTIILCAGDPRRYGFPVDHRIYDRIERVLQKGYRSYFMRHFWNEILEHAKNESLGDELFVFSNEEKERKELKKIFSLIEVNNDRGVSDVNGITRARYLLQMKYPVLHRWMVKWMKKG